MESKIIDLEGRPHNSRFVKSQRINMVLRQALHRRRCSDMRGQSVIQLRADSREPVQFYPDIAAGLHKKQKEFDAVRRQHGDKTWCDVSSLATGYLHNQNSCDWKTAGSRNL